MPFAKLREAAALLLLEPPAETNIVRRVARQLVQTAAVLTGLLLFTTLLGPGFASLGSSSDPARLGLLALLAGIYGALYIAASKAHRRAAAAWSSALLVVLELSMLITLIPLMALLIGPLLPENTVKTMMDEGNMFFELTFFLGMMVFTMRGWGRYMARAAQVETTQQAVAFYERLAHEDALTGLANRRRFEGELTARLSNEAATPTAVLMIDVNRFKQINDTHSHDTGDEVLKGIAQVLQAQVHAPDLPARLAGDEFVVMLCNTSPELAALAAERIADAVRGHAWQLVHPRLQVSVSVGAAMAHQGDTLSALMRRSDAQMYRSKRGQATGPALVSAG